MPGQRSTILTPSEQAALLMRYGPKFRISLRYPDTNLGGSYVRRMEEFRIIYICHHPLACRMSSREFLRVLAFVSYPQGYGHLS